jgi:hypothetical protein
MHNGETQESEVSDVILDALGNSVGALTYGDLVEKLAENHDFSTSAIRRALQKLQDENRILALPEDVKGQGRPKYVYRALNQSPGTLTTMDRVSEERERNESPEDDNVLRDIVNQAIGGELDRMSPSQRRSVYKETALALLTENPIELILEFAKWCVETHRYFYGQYEDAGDHRLKEKMKVSMIYLEKIGRRVFNQWLGVPWDVPTSEDEGMETPFRLKYTNNDGDLSEVHESSLRKYLNWTIMGDSFLEIIDINPQERPLRIGGSDSSSYWTDLGKIIPWNTSSRPLAIITAVGARYDINKKVPETFINPDPKVLAQYSRSKAVDEGFLITPEMLQDEETMVQRIHEAAMDLRQYVKDYEILFQMGITKMHFRDGRVFPVEHRFSDAVNFGPHGELVRKGLQAFSNLVRGVGSEEGRVLLCGFVKRVNLDIIAPLVLWHMSFRKKESGGRPLLVMTPEEYVKSPHLYSHNQVVNNLFFALSDTIPKGKAVVTFRSLRRFQSMQEEPIKNAPPSADRDYWENRLRELVKNRREDYLDEAVSNYAFLTAKASVLTFYSSEPSTLNPEHEKDIVVPRIETLAPYLKIGYPESGDPELRSVEKRYVSEIVSVMTDSEVLEVYPDSLFPFGEGSPKIFMAPKPVCSAHEISKDVARMYSEEMLALLAREARASWFRLLAKRQ